MSINARLVRAGFALAASSFALAACSLVLTACSSEPAEVEQKRRELLTPPDYKQLRAERKAKAQLLDEEGMPIPSDQVFGGLQIPRGFTLIRSFEREWYLQSAGVSSEALSRYVEKRVFTGTLVRTSIGGYRFESCTLRDSKNAPRLDVRITPISGEELSAELYIRQAAPAVPGVQRPPEAQVEAQMQARRLHAD